MYNENTDMKRLLLSYNLQFFADDGDKTEEPTAKKIEDSRKEGQVAKSKELTSAFSLLALFLCLKFFIGFLGSRFIELFDTFWGEMGIYAKSEFSTVTVWQICLEAIVSMLLICAPFMLVALLVAFLTQRMQIKWMVTTKPLQPKFNKLNPVNGFKRIFSMRALFDLGFSLLKIVLFGAIAFSYVKDHMKILLTLYDLTLQDALSNLLTMVYELGIRISAVYIVLSFADLMYQRYKHKKELKMTKQEVKDEYKNQEGDPKVKSQQKQRMLQASRRRMMESVPQADVVITNPTHFAVALKYDNTVSMAPVVVAKGADYMAQKIKDIAKEYDIICYEDVPTARMLYYNVEVGDEIPRELFEAVATALAYVYEIKGKKAV